MSFLGIKNQSMAARQWYSHKVLERGVTMGSWEDRSSGRRRTRQEVSSAGGTMDSCTRTSELVRSVDGLQGQYILSSPSESAVGRTGKRQAA